MIIYNPKRFEGRPSQPITEFRFGGVIYELEVNEMKKFPEDAGTELLKTYGFLEKVAPERVTEIKKLMDSKDYACEHCGDVFDSKKALQMHKVGKHKLTKEAEELLGLIPEAGKSGDEAVLEEAGKFVDDMPKGVDKDGVEIVGDGVEDDVSPTMKKSGGTF